MGTCVPRTVIALCVVLGSPAQASFLELFAKASASKSYTSADKYTVSLYGTAGLAITLIPSIRIEGRYISIGSLQNRLDYSTETGPGFLKDLKSQTTIYSAGFDFDLLGEKSVFQPFFFVGVGYFESDRSYYNVKGGSATFEREAKKRGVSANLGAGFKLRLARRLAFEIEVSSYITDVKEPNPLINLFGTAGIRIFI